MTVLQQHYRLPRAHHAPGKLLIATHVPDATGDLKEAQDMTEPRSFLVLGNNCRRFTLSFARFANQLNKMIE